MLEEIKATYVIFDSYDFAIEEHKAIIRGIRSDSAFAGQQALVGHIGDITGLSAAYFAEIPVLSA